MKKLNKEQAAIISLYTGILVGPFDEMHEYAERIAGHPIFAHQFADKKLIEHLKSLSKKDLLKICREKED